MKWSNYWCKCDKTCGDVEDESGVCKSLPKPPKKPLVEVILVPRREG